MEEFEIGGIGEAPPSEDRAGFEAAIQAGLGDGEAALGFSDFGVMGGKVAAAIFECSFEVGDGGARL